jgi:hypothetical protein
MFTTPAIPTWIKEIEHPLYRTIFSYRLGNENLWGTVRRQNLWAS